MIEDILPAAVVAVETRVDPPEATLFPEEAAVVAGAVAKRRTEFAAVRHCARQAFEQLGVPAAPILPGDRGAPQWPDGVVGSMTHCAGYRAAVVARRSEILTVGIDAEPHVALPDGVLDAVSLPQERTWLAELARRSASVHWDKLLFAAKESVYKAWFPLTGKWLGFEDAEIALDADAGTFRARLLVPGPEVDGTEVTGFDGRWLVSGGFAFAAIAVPAAS